MVNICQYVEYVESYIVSDNLSALRGDQRAGLSCSTHCSAAQLGEVVGRAAASDKFQSLRCLSLVAAPSAGILSSESPTAGMPTLFRQISPTVPEARMIASAFGCRHGHLSGTELAACKKSSNT